MKEWEYIRLMNRNYLQVKVEEQAIEELFQYRMMISEPIKGLLGCRMRELNGMNFLLYDISSMQSICSIYAEKKMDFSSFYQLIYCIGRTVKNMKEYLLEEENLFLYPEFIFQEIDSKEINFVYYPSEDGGVNDSGKKLYEFLLTVADHEDDTLTEMIYQTYESIGDEEGFSWIELLERKVREEQDRRNQSIGGGEKEEIFKEEEKKFDTLAEDFEVPVLLSGEEKNEKQKASPTKQVKKAIVFIFLYASAVGFGMYYLYSNYVMNLQENVVTWVALVVTTAVLAFWMFMWLKKDNKHENEIVFEKEEISIPVEKFAESYVDQDVYGKTVFFEAEEIENKLYGIGKKNKRIIQMNKFPFIIGKKEGSVDGLLEEASVSRVHARFYQRDSALWMEDLNSTNGTYKNGIMLAPHEKVEVLPEDEIRFGKLQFIYR